MMQWHSYLDFKKDVLIIIIIKPVSRCDVLLYTNTPILSITILIIRSCTGSTSTNPLIY